MYAIKPKINFKKAFLNLVFTKNIKSIAKNIQPIDPNDIHILSIDDTNNTGNTNFPTFLQLSNTPWHICFCATSSQKTLRPEAFGQLDVGHSGVAAGRSDLSQSSSKFSGGP